MNAGKKGVWSVMHVLDSFGNILSHNHFCDKHNLHCYLTKIIKKIPIQIISVIEKYLKYSVITPNICDLTIENVEFAERKYSQILDRFHN